MVISEKSFAGYGSYVRPNRVPLGQAFAQFIGAVNAEIESHRPVFETPKRRAPGSKMFGSRAQVVDLVGARVARKMGR